MIARPDLRCHYPECNHTILETKDYNGVSHYQCRFHGIVNPQRVSEVPVQVKATRSCHPVNTADDG